MFGRHRKKLLNFAGICHYKTALQKLAISHAYVLQDPAFDTMRRTCESAM